MEQLQATILNALVGILGTIITIAGGYAIVYIKKGFEYLTTKTSVIKDENARKVVDNALNSLDNLLTTNITYAESVLKPNILSSISDGKVTSEELESLATIVKDNVLKQLGTDTTVVLNNSIGDLDGYISARLEAVLSNLKIQETSSVSKTVIETKTEEIK